MGVGLPYAMGIKLAKPDADVFCITGEGSIQMCIQELSTCKQYNTPVKVISAEQPLPGHGASVAATGSILAAIAQLHGCAA
jgi:TPP-dependent trihydroxycyclohexane-1,2-dione (THcHDO) dehydratase